jgi:N-methylhydantoinase A
MQEAIKAISTMRGHDLRDFHLLAFGGAGPLHAAEMARELGMAGVLVPSHPGVYSAMGLLMSDVSHDYVRSKPAALAEATVEELTSVFDELERAARKDLHDEDFAAGDIAIEYGLDLRYAGQGYEISIPCRCPLDDESIARLRKDFDAQHKQMFGHTAPEEPVEIVSYRARGIGRVPPVKIRSFEAAGIPLSRALRETRPARFNGTMFDTPVYQRELLDVGITFDGPAIVDQLDCTTVVPPGHRASVDRFRNLLITVAS